MNNVEYDENANPNGQTLEEWMKENGIENMEDILKKEEDELDRWLNEDQQ